MTTTWSPPPPTTPPAQPSRAPSISRSYSDQNAHSTETVSSSSYMMLLRELEQFSSSEITNALVSLGLSHRAMDAHVQRGGRLPDIHMLSPWPNDRSGQYMRICGYAYTIKIVPAATAYPPIVSILPQAIDAAPMGSIIVVSVPLNMNTAVWDNNMTVHAKSRGIRGAIIGGAPKILFTTGQPDSPYLLKGIKKLRQAGFVHPVETSGPIIVFPRTDLEDCFENGLSALKIHPGDIIVADRDGVACIPPELSRRVFEICRYTRQMNEGQAGGM
ncbi:Aldolase/RraA [Rhizoctonia solani]|uniref:Aldolase/RraA n=1 Tax=Rhizoctonia solani TaxID=456999 RepID=A0A8H7M5Y6_9AGAM|nr:Aldolase/RraA [Rhizoctonia solani]